MKNIIYPAVFHKAEEGGYWVEFPDLPGCVTEADTLEEAVVMAGDALFVWFDDEQQEQPAPSAVSDIKVEGDDFVTLVKAEPYESEAALILGVDRSYFTYIISGKKTPSPDMAKRIGLLLGFDWRVFYADGATAY